MSKLVIKKRGTRREAGGKTIPVTEFLKDLRYIDDHEDTQVTEERNKKRDQGMEVVGDWLESSFKT